LIRSVVLGEKVLPLIQSGLLDCVISSVDYSKSLCSMSSDWCAC